MLKIKTIGVANKYTKKQKREEVIGRVEVLEQVGELLLLSNTEMVVKNNRDVRSMENRGM